MYKKTLKENHADLVDQLVTHKQNGSTTAVYILLMRVLEALSFISFMAKS